MIQGDVYLYTFKSPDKRRPALILTRTNLIPKVNAVTVAPVTTTFRDADTHVALDENDGMKEECVVNLASIQTVSKEKIGSINYAFVAGKNERSKAGNRIYVRFRMALKYANTC